MDNLFFGLDKPASDENLVLLRTFHDDVSVTMAEEILRDEGIFCLAMSVPQSGLLYSLQKCNDLQNLLSINKI